MARRHYQLPSLTSLNAFDACARHGSFTAAAAELGVTLGAVSRQVKGLENELGCALFLRRHRGVELTTEGLELYHTLSSSFQQIGRLCREIRNRVRGADVTIGTTTAFASLWLMPRLGDFWRRYREINLSHAISDNPADSGFVSADIRIRYGDGSWRGEHATRLFGDRIYPVAGREIAAQQPGSDPSELLRFPLLQLDSVDPAWTAWDDWLGHWNSELSEARVRRFNNYVVALHAARQNQGIVLGWHTQVEEMIDRGELMRIGELDIEAPGSYYLTWDPQRPLSESAECLRDWLIEVGRRDSPVG